MLITKEVEITLNSRNIARLESLGYEMPREKDDKSDNLLTIESLIKEINRLANGYNYAEIIM